MRSRGARAAAFTLLELMVVISLIGILTAMIVPEMGGTYDEALLRASARKLADACHLASSRAVARNQRHALQVDARTGRFAVVEVAPRANRDASDEARAQIPGGSGRIDPRIAVELRRADDEPAASPDSADSAPPLAAPTDDAGETADAPSERRDTALLFNSDGTAEAAEIRLRDRLGFRLALRINPVTAGVRVKDLGKE